MNDTMKALAKLESDAAKLELADQFIEGWDHFLKGIDFRHSFLDVRAVAWMKEISIKKRAIKEKP